MSSLALERLWHDTYGWAVGIPDQKASPTKQEPGLQLWKSRALIEHRSGGFSLPYAGSSHFRIWFLLFGPPFIAEGFQRRHCWLDLRLLLSQQHGRRNTTCDWPSVHGISQADCDAGRLLARRCRSRNRRGRFRRQHIADGVKYNVDLSYWLDFISIRERLSYSVEAIS